MKFVDERIPRDLWFAFQEYDVGKLDIHEHAFNVIEWTLAWGDRRELRFLIELTTGDHKQ
jgi:hypothetical protein